MKISLLLNLYVDIRMNQITYKKIISIIKFDTRKYISY